MVVSWSRWLKSRTETWVIHEIHKRDGHYDGAFWDSRKRLHGGVYAWS